MQCLLEGDRAQCFKIVKELLEKDVPIHDLYLGLFQKSLYEVGELWENNRISVAVEHMATSITESLLTLAYPRIFAAEHNGRKAVISCIANEFHQIGGKMVADFFELNGWDGYFLGANTPASEMMDIIHHKQPDMLALSLSIYFNMNSLYQILELIKKAHPGLKVIVGGQAFQWGGRDISSRFPGVEYVASIYHLEALLESYEPA
ncbi:cobalamin B12-binding domain-containing protein [Desulfonatronovibrio hydrogenovorans]|uniref:cobalamin B12-binding domain-containing protein n=1 Tax=Desulfonatronovibrio hydrogenovorans TaxID=53245 RepID=UPI000A481124|nr:cobalamin-dependent protein [Desulfonatronovibrio hydrogenovorans]